MTATLTEPKFGIPQRNSLGYADPTCYQALKEL